MLHEVDELLRGLVRSDALNGSGVELAFDAPTKDWVARRNAPTVDLYLYDIREDVERRLTGLTDIRGDDGKVTDRRRPPKRFKLAYLVTAWTQRPEDEHRLLSALLSCFLRHPEIPVAELGDELASANLPVMIDVALPPSQDRALADVWSALGGELKPSLDVIVTAPIAIDRRYEFGPPVLEEPLLGLEGPDTAERVRRRPGTDGGPAPRIEPLPAGTVPAVPDGSDIKTWVRGRRRR